MPRELCFVRYMTPTGPRSVGGRNPQLVQQNGPWYLVLDRLRADQPDYTFAPHIALENIVEAFTWFDSATIGFLNRGFEAKCRAELGLKC